MKNFDNNFLTNGIKLIAGVDEAGRGPLAGPVVAAAVIFENATKIDAVNDSKKLNEKTRERLFLEITESCLSYGIGIVDVREIDEINILQASLKAMKLAVAQLEPSPDLILIDGNKVFNSSIQARAIVKGDSKSFSIAAASIIAKVTRDRLMMEFAEKHPQYLWHKNKGYGTSQHIDAIRNFGPTKLHRRTFLGNIFNEEQLDNLFS